MRLFGKNKYQGVRLPGKRRHIPLKLFVKLPSEKTYPIQAPTRGESENLFQSALANADV